MDPIPLIGSLIAHHGEHGIWYVARNDLVRATSWKSRFTSQSPCVHQTETRPGQVAKPLFRPIYSMVLLSDSKGDPVFVKEVFCSCDSGLQLAGRQQSQARHAHCYRVRRSVWIVDRCFARLRRWKHVKFRAQVHLGLCVERWQSYLGGLECLQASMLGQ